MKLYGKAEETAAKVIKAFETGSIGKAMADVFINWNSKKPCAKWSFNNRLIVALSGETDARGFRQWETVERNVKAGEKAINILAPVLVKVKEADATGKASSREKLVGFKSIPVFGLNQTEGKALPGSVETTNFVKTLPLADVAEAWGIKVDTYNGEEGSAKGSCALTADRIALGVQNLSTWAHELIHAADIKNDGYDKAHYDEGEVVAELGGAVLLIAIGKDEAADLGGAWDYIKNWTRDNEGKHALSVCMKLMGRVCRAVETIIEAAGMGKKEEAEAA
jgi:hypothetical protein